MNDSTPRTILLSVVAATATSVLAWFALDQSQAERPSRQNEVRAEETGRDDLSDRLAALEAALAKRQEPARSTPESTDLEAVVTARLDAIEDAIADLRTRSRERRAPGATEQEAPLVSSIDVLRQRLEEEANARDAGTPVEELQRSLLDPTATPEQQLEIWKQMRGRKGAYDAATVARIVQTALTHEDADFRADIWRNAHGRSTHPDLGRAAVQALGDREASVREKAAEVLDAYLDQPGVRATLQSLLSNDPDRSVRAAAAEALAGGERKGR